MYLRITEKDELGAANTQEQETASTGESNAVLYQENAAQEAARESGKSTAERRQDIQATASF